MYTEELISIDMFPENFHPIIELLGIEKTLSLIRNYAGSTIYIPKLDCCIRHYRNEALIKDHKAGMSCIKIGKKYNLTTLEVRKIIEKNREYIEDKE